MNSKEKRKGWPLIAWRSFKEKLWRGKKIKKRFFFLQFSFKNLLWLFENSGESHFVFCGQDAFRFLHPALSFLGVQPFFNFLQKIRLTTSWWSHYNISDLRQDNGTGFELPNPSQEEKKPVTKLRLNFSQNFCNFLLF